MPYQHFDSDNRDALQILLGTGADSWMIARILWKHLSSVYSELSRNTNSVFYLSHHASFAAEKSLRASRSSPKRGATPLMIDIELRLRNDHSPKQIAGRLKLDHPREPVLYISYKTIYKYIYAEARRVGRSRHAHPPKAQETTQTPVWQEYRRGIISNRAVPRLTACHRGNEIAPGRLGRRHRQGGGKKGYVGTFADSESKFLVAFPLKRKTAAKIVQCVRQAFAAVPTNRKRTATVDNGKEFARHGALASAMGAKEFFARPYQSWERGLNEQTNGLLRQYLPNRLSLDNPINRHLARIVQRINTMLRKPSGCRTLRKVFLKPPFALQT